MSEGPEAGDGPNPFSFKTFVKRASTADPSSTARPKSGSKSSSSRKKGEGEKRKKKKWKPGDGEGEGVPFPELGGGRSDTGTSTLLCSIGLACCVLSQILDHKEF